MRKMTLMLLACFPLLVFGQVGRYTIQGTLGTYSAPAKVYLHYHDKSGNKVDSAMITDGKFTFQGNITDDPIMATIAFNRKGTGPTYDDPRQVYLENGIITVNGKDSLGTAAIAGTQINIDNAKLDDMQKALDSYYNQLTRYKNSVSEQEKASDEYKKKVDQLDNALSLRENEINKKFILDDPDSYISLVVLSSYAYSADYSEIEPLFNGLSERLKQTVRGKHFAELLPHLKAVSIGSTAPEFTEADTAGKMVSLSAFRGKYVLVDFWASWCGPCRQENPNVVKAFNRYKGQNFTVIGVSLDSPDGRDRWLEAISKDGLPWTQVSDLKGWGNAAATLYGIKAIPQNFLLDPNGKIVAKNLRGDDLENKLEEIFGKI